MKLVKHLVLFAGAGLSLIACDSANDRKDHLKEDQNVSSSMLDDSQQTYTQFEVTIENIGPAFSHILTEVANTPVGKSEAGPVHPGESYEFTFKAGRGQNLSLFTMVAASNDLFISPGTAGIPLYDSEGNQRSGDLTSELRIWDAGTEHNQPLGEGSDQPANNSGGPEDPNTQVRIVADGSYDGLDSINSLIEVSLEAMEGQTFKVIVKAKEEGLSPLTPVLYTVHNAPHEVFAEGEAEKSNGLELLAEQGDPSELIETLKAKTGYFSPFSPGLYAVHGGSFELFEEGALASAGLEDLAENGSPAVYEEEVRGVANKSGVFDIPEGSSEAGVIGPGGQYKFTFLAKPGDKLSLASMLVQSNDWFVATSSAIELFDYSGNGVKGDVTTSFGLYDAGTEVDQELGLGNDQAPRQLSKDGPQDENDRVRKVDELDVSRYLKVSINATP